MHRRPFVGPKPPSPRWGEKRLTDIRSPRVPRRAAARPGGHLRPRPSTRGYSPYAPSGRNRRRDPAAVATDAAPAAAVFILTHITHHDRLLDGTPVAEAKGIIAALATRKTWVASPGFSSTYDPVNRLARAKNFFQRLKLVRCGEGNVSKFNARLASRPWTGRAEQSPVSAPASWASAGNRRSPGRRRADRQPGCGRQLRRAAPS